MSQTDGPSGRYPQARSASGQVATFRSTPSVRRSQFGFAPASSITSSLVFSTSGRSISYSRVPDGQRRRKARVSRPAAARTTWRIPNLLQASSKKSSKKRVRITGYSPGPSEREAAFCRWPDEHAHVSGIHRNVLLVLAAGASSCSLGLSGRNGAVPLARDVEYGAPDVGDVHPMSLELHLPLDELVALVEVPHPPPENLARKGCSVVDPLAHRQPRTHGNVSLGPLPHRLQRRVVDA